MLNIYMGNVWIPCHKTSYLCFLYFHCHHYVIIVFADNCWLWPAKDAHFALDLLYFDMCFVLCCNKCLVFVSDWFSHSLQNASLIQFHTKIFKWKENITNLKNNLIKINSLTWLTHTLVVLIWFFRFYKEKEKLV